MKGRRLLFTLGSAVLVVPMIIPTVTRGTTQPTLERRLERWSSALRQAARNPFFLDRLEQIVDEARQMPGVAPAVMEAYSTGLLDRLTAGLSMDVQERILAAAGKTFSLTFPHGGNGQGGGLVLQMNVILLNNSETNAVGTIRFRKTDGSPWSVNTNQGAASSFKFSLLPGESFRLETDGSGALSVGWIEVVSDIPLSGAATFVVSSSSRQFLSEVGVGDSPQSKSVMIFVDTTEGKNTGFAICNPKSSTAAKLKLQLNKLDGSAVGSKELNLAALNQKSEFVSETFPGTDLKNFKGILLITSDVEVSVITLRTKDVRFTSLPGAPGVTDTSQPVTLYFARTGDGVFGSLKLQSSFVLLNNSGKKATVSIELTKSDGTPMALVIGGTKNNKFNLEIPPGTAVELVSDGSTSPGVTGWAKVTSDIPLTGAGTFSIRDNRTGEFVSEVGVGSSPTDTSFSIFAQVSGDIDTGFGITNPLAISQTITLRLVSGTTGVSASRAENVSVRAPAAVIAEKTVQLARLGHNAWFISDIFAEAPEIRNRNFEGRVEAASGGFFTGITLRTRGAFLTSLPVAPFSKTAFVPKLKVVPATSLEGSRPALYVTLHQNSTEALLRSALLTFDQGSVDFSRLEGKTGILGAYIVNEFGVLTIGRLWAQSSGTDSAEIYSSLTEDGKAEVVPFVGKITNKAGGGFTIELQIQSIFPSGVSFTNDSTLCFDPGIVSLPSGAGTVIDIKEEYQSYEQTVEGGDILKRTASSSLITSGISAGNPRVDSVTPTRIVAGSEAIISGSGFDAATQVTLEGNSRIEATILENSATRLKVRIPESARTGSLRVESGGKTSNDYRLEVLFAPRPNLTFGSLANNAETTLKLVLTQKQGEIPVLDFILKPTQGSWKTAGFTVDATVGTFQIGTTKFNLKVKSSDSSKLILNGIEEGKTDPRFTIELSNSGGPSLTLRSIELSETIELGNDISIELNFTQAIFKMPSGVGMPFDVNMEIVSFPERTKIRVTSFPVTRKQSFTTS